MLLNPTGAVAPGPHWLPAGAVQFPLHNAVVRPALTPYRPAGHGVHAVPPPRPYCPAGHVATVAEGDVDPAGHSDPGATVQFPEHKALTRPVPLPNRPAGHNVH